MNKIEVCGCEQSIHLQKVNYKLQDHITDLEEANEVLQARNEELETFFNRTQKDVKKVDWKDGGHDCQSRKTVEAIYQRIRRLKNEMQ